ncbi:MAG: hypothetical protein HFH91_17380 [Lachnospiraceae bacterium]|nr:hypothetical protein [Lachnospiraceae bacterium]
MKKEKHILLRIAGMILLVTMLTGCEGMALLDEIPRDFIFCEILSGKVAQEEDVPEESSVEEAEPEVCYLMEEAFPFSCNTLSREEQLWYHDMERILGGFQEKVRLSREGIEAGLDETDVDRIFQCVLNDHPELFYVDGYSYTKYMRGDRLLDIEFSGSYNTDSETAAVRREEILAAADAILDGAAAISSDYEKVKYVYETLIRNTDYDLDAPDNQNIYSVFVHHLSVCQGYAKATQYLLNRLGLECTLVLGTVETGEGHAWNLVKVDGEYYYVDTTWGDVSYRTEDMQDAGGGVSLNMPEINYDYLNVTTEEIQRTHTIGGLVAMPHCTATGANYYVREGAFFTSYDREQMGALFRRAIEEGRNDVTIKCCDALCYETMVSELIEEQEIFQYLTGGESSIAYAQNEKQLSLTFWVTNS